MSRLYIDKKSNKVYLDYTDQFGKRQRKSLKINPEKGRIPAEARLIQKKVDAEISLGIFGIKKKPKKIVFEQFAEEYLNYVKVRKSQGQLSNEKYILKKLKTVLHPEYLNDITVAKADFFITQITPTMTANGVNWYIRGLKAIFNTALRWKYIEENPFLNIKRLSIELPLPRVLTIKEIELLYKTIQQNKSTLIPLFIFYLLTGCRLSEALNLNWDDIDFQKNTIIFRKTKTKKIRIVPMGEEIKKLLLGRKYEVTPFSGSRDNISKSFTEMFRLANIKNASLHSLRSTFASYLADSGIPEATNQKLLGHTSEVSRRHYLGFTQEMVQERLQKTEKKLINKLQINKK